MGRLECRPGRLASLLQTYGRSITDLSAATEIPVATIRGYLNGGRDTISTRNLLLIARFFGMPMSELMDRLASDDPAPIDNADKDESKISSD